MVKLIGNPLMFLFLGCKSQYSKQSALFKLADYSSNVIQLNKVTVKIPVKLFSYKFLAPFGENAVFLLKHSAGHL